MVINKPTRCPLAEWDLEDSGEDKRTIQPEKSKCFLPAVFVKHGCPDNFFTSGIFKCPECYSDAEDYMNCDLFSRWWWYQFGGGIKKHRLKKEVKKIKKKITLDIPISDGTIPLIDSGTKDRNTITNWAKFKTR